MSPRSIRTCGGPSAPWKRRGFTRRSPAVPSFASRRGRDKMPGWRSKFVGSGQMMDHCFGDCACGACPMHRTLSGSRSRTPLLDLMLSGPPRRGRPRMAIGARGSSLRRQGPLPDLTDRRRWDRTQRGPSTSASCSSGGDHRMSPSFSPCGSTRGCSEAVLDAHSSTLPSDGLVHGAPNGSCSGSWPATSPLSGSISAWASW
jgi:hypothetical protein